MADPMAYLPLSRKQAPLLLSCMDMPANPRHACFAQKTNDSTNIKERKQQAGMVTNVIVKYCHSPADPLLVLKKSSGIATAP